jgi:hypothetical protein
MGYIAQMGEGTSKQAAGDEEGALGATPARRRRARPPATSVSEADVLRKAVNTLAIVPKSARITALGRKSYNVLLFHAQDQGLEREVFRVPLEMVIKGLDFDSNDHALIKKHLRAMVSTTVEWQSPTTGEGSSWNVSGLLAHARLSKERGQVWIEWSYAVNLKQELLQPTVFARLRLEIISQLRSHAGVALYEICTRYKGVGLTARQAWRWWQPVLSGNPANEKSARQEYRIFKRDTLKPAIAEINAITDIEIELVEHKLGRFVDMLQFRIQPKKQSVLPLSHPPQPVDLGLVALAQRLGVPDEAAEALALEHGEPALRTGLEALQRRLASAFPEPLRDPLRYLRSLMPAEAARAARAAEAAAAPVPGEGAPALPAGVRELQARRQAQWRAEWMRRRRQRFAEEIAALAPERQAELCETLLSEFARLGRHPSLSKRLQGSGWQHPMVLDEMIRFYAVASHGEHWDKPTADELLAVAAEMGEGPGTATGRP